MAREDATNLQVNGSATSSQEDSAAASRPYSDDIIISWPELHRDARYLCEILHGMGPWKGIIAITRGGLVPAALVARELDIRLIETVCITSYGTSSSIEAEQQRGSLQVLKMIEGDGDGFLLIDDLVYSGWTLNEIGWMMSRRGSGPVFPVVLALALGRRA